MKVISLDLSLLVGLGGDDLATATCIVQDDFRHGTFFISTPGKYKLCEDITFDPNGPKANQSPSPDAYDPTFPSDIYDENAFGLGFFAAIVIDTSDVDLYLNGFTIEQSPGHALMQRFFAVIELADSPFIANTGPAQFLGSDDSFHAASNIRIVGPGTIGRSAHHGIHGNENENILISEVTFVDFEVAAVSLNNVDNLVIEDCAVEKNRHDVPVLGLFSAARFIRPYAKHLANLNYNISLRGHLVNATTLYDNLITSINNVFNDVRIDGFIDNKTHPMEYKLFHNPFKVVDGPCYVFNIHGRGPAVNGQGFILDESDQVTSSNIIIRNNTITNIQCWSNEIPAVMVQASPDVFVAANDARGAILELVSNYDTNNPQRAINADGTYKGNVVADLQIMVANAIHDGTLKDHVKRQTATNTINEELVQWAQGTDSYVPEYICNSDAMFHVIKGIIVIRVEDTRGFIIEDNFIDGVASYSPPAFTQCDQYHPKCSPENLLEHQAGNIRGISVAAVRGYNENQSAIRNNQILNFASPNCEVMVGIDVQGDAESISIEENSVNLILEEPDVEQVCYALRVREHADVNSIDVSSNFLSQNVEIPKARRLRHVKDVPSGHPQGFDLEWQTGGCPFARSQSRARSDNIM